jgi:hypothetical protein
LLKSGAMTTNGTFVLETGSRTILTSGYSFASSLSLTGGNLEGSGTVNAVTQTGGLIIPGNNLV